MTALTNAAGKDISEDEAIRLFGRIQARIRRYKGDGLSDIDAAVRAGGDVGAELKLAASIQKRSRLNNIIKHRVATDRINDASLLKDLTAIIRKTDNEAFGLRQEYVGRFWRSIEAIPGARKALKRKDKAFDRLINKELWSITEGKGSVTGNKLAHAIANAITDNQDFTRAQMNNAGAWIGRLDQYIAKQSHDMDAIRGKGTEADYIKWRDFELERLDPSTFDHLETPDAKSIDEYMLKKWQDFSAGKHETAAGSVAMGDVGAGTGSSNVAKKVSEGRTWKYKDADAWTDHNQTYGKGDTLSSVVHSLESASRAVALMNNLGNNPVGMYQTLQKETALRARRLNKFKEEEKIDGSFNGRVLDVVTGAASVPEDMNIARFSAIVQSFETVAKLGFATISSISDLANNAAVLRHNGVGLVQAYANQIGALLPKGAAEREVARSADVGVDSFSAALTSRYATMDPVRGRAAKTVELFHKLTFLEWWTDSLKFGMGSVLTHNMGRSAVKDFAALDARLQATLARYDIGAGDWEALRSHAVKAADGRMHVFAGDIEDAALRTKYGAYIQGQVREAMNEPDAFIRAGMSAGTNAGTPMGAAMRLLLQFKSYPVTFTRNMWNREVRGNGAGMDVVGIAHMVAATTVLGLVSLELKSLLQNKTSRLGGVHDNGDAATLLFNAMAQGGGLGFFGDFLLGSQDHPESALLGPAAGTVGSLFKAAQEARRGVLEGEENMGTAIASQAAAFAKGHAPMVNLWYTRGLLDYFIWDRLQEAANPGYLRRHEQMMQKRTGQEPIFRP
jgi:hypothetical protein